MVNGKRKDAQLYGRRVGVLGGTFDPVHNGHLAVAGYVLKMLRLDSIIFIPAARPPHKGHLQLTPFSHRLAMLECGLREEPRYFVSAMEEQREGPSYSVDTLEELRGNLGPDVRLSFIIGMDAFVEIDTWKDYHLIPNLADLVVIDRPEHPLTLIGKTVDKLGHYKFNSTESVWSASDHFGKIFAVSMPPVDVSSTMVRERLYASLPVMDCLPPAVSEYIDRQGLFV
ncbi:MAG: nicotinate-nucleotide adenylyltransferase [Thermodesulfobacteriota bacterium]